MSFVDGYYYFKETVLTPVSRRGEANQLEGFPEFTVIVPGTLKRACQQASVGMLRLFYPRLRFVR